MIDMNPNTPYFVIHQNELDTNFLKLSEAMTKHWSNYTIGYSYKTNSLPWVVNHFKKLGCFAEVVSDDEYHLARYIGYEPSKIIYNGPVKSKETFIEALRAGAIVNVDSQREIKWLDDVEPEYRKVGIRVNFNIEKYCSAESQCGGDGGRFGFCYENGELGKALSNLKINGVLINGLHLHTSSKTRSVNIYKAIAEVACEIKKEFNLSFDYLDIGGGFFGGLPNKPQFDEYFYEVEKILSSEFSIEQTKLIVEPGMAVIGSCVSYVTKVIDVKDTTYNRFVVTDGSRTAIDPLMTKTSYFNEIKSEQQKDVIHKQIVCGFTCMEHDRLFELIDKPALSVGDGIIYNNVGAYTMCLSPLFIKYFPSVYVEKENGTLKQVRNAWTVEEYIQNSIFED